MLVPSVFNIHVMMLLVRYIFLLIGSGLRLQYSYCIVQFVGQSYSYLCYIFDRKGDFKLTGLWPRNEAELQLRQPDK